LKNPIISSGIEPPTFLIVAYKLSVGNPEEENYFGKLILTLDDNIKMCFEEME
jgi:hypothetical protein